MNGGRRLRLAACGARCTWDGVWRWRAGGKNKEETVVLSPFSDAATPNP